MSKPFYERSKKERKDVEDPCIEFAQMRGWWHTKITSPTRDSLPDDLFVRKGVYVWWEFKAPGEEPSGKQLKRHRDMRKFGMDVRWTSDPAEFKEQMR
jgi:hypothetical protein